MSGIGIASQVVPLLLIGGGFVLTGAATYGLPNPQENHLARLHPKAQGPFREFIRRVESETGWRVQITSGYRTRTEQEHLIRGGRHYAVRNSAHLFGFALDINLLKDGKRITSRSSNAAWEATGAVAIAKSLGMRWGGDFQRKSRVHFDLFWSPALARKWIAMAEAQFGPNWGDRGNQLVIR